MRTIYKQDLSLTDDQYIEVPVGAKLLHIDIQNQKPCIWYECESKNVLKKLRILCFGTGREIPYTNNLRYIGTVLVASGNGVFHFYEEL